VTGHGGGVDLAEVARDAELLDQLAARAEGADGDTVAALLAAFAAEVDEGLAGLLRDLDEGPLLDEPAAAGIAAVPDLPGQVRRGHGLRATTVAVVIAATLSVSGVAAAVTGDPFSPYRGIVSAVTGGDDLPPQAARVAALNRHLAGTRARIAHGDLAGAQATLAGLRHDLASMTDLTSGERAVLEARIAALEASLGGATAKSGKQPKAGSGSSHPAVPNSTRTAEPKAARTTEPKAASTSEPKATGTGGTHTAEPRDGKGGQPTDPAVVGGDVQPDPAATDADAATDTDTGSDAGSATDDGTRGDGAVDGTGHAKAGSR
jgi:hypothetical protein